MTLEFLGPLGVALAASRRVIGRRLPGAQGSAAAAGILSSAVPFLADLLAIGAIVTASTVSVLAAAAEPS